LNLKEILMSTASGFVVGILFARVKLPVPAPPTLSGVMGIVGMFLGYILAVRVMGWGK
jgi:XapX domain-containing protein